MSKVEADLIQTFTATLGRGHFTIDGWIATIGIWMAPAILLRELVPIEQMRTFQLLLVLNFLKEYRAEAAACLQFGYRAESTYEYYAWEGLKLLDHFLPSVRPHQI